MKLISMLEFMLNECDAVHNKKTTPLAPTNNPDNLFHQRSESWKTIIRYANFLSQPLTLGMFVPCDLKGNVLHEVKMELRDSEQEAAHNYLEAKKRVLFKGIGVDSKNYQEKYIGNSGYPQDVVLCFSEKYFDKFPFLKYSYFKNHTVEYLLEKGHCLKPGSFELTETAIKQIFGNV